MITLKTIDAHVAGAPLRLVVDGFPAPRGKTMIEKRAWIERRADHLCRLLMLEPRGHRDMCGAVLTEPVSPGAHAGLLFMQQEHFPTMSLHGVVAATAIALERQLLVPGGDSTMIEYDTPAGSVRAYISGSEGDLVIRVANVPSFVVVAGLPVSLPGPVQRQTRADLAFGGGFYAIVDAEAVGLGVSAAHVPELRRAGIEIARAIDETRRLVHPIEPELSGLAGTIFTGPPQGDTAVLRCVTVSATGEVERSPGGSGMCAVMAVLSQMGLLDEAQPFTAEGLIGSTLTGRITGSTTVGDIEAVRTEVSGSAWVTGEHTFILHDTDLLGEGFAL